MSDEDNTPMTEEQRVVLLNFADKLDIFRVVAGEMREAKTVGQAVRLIARLDELAAALMAI